MRDPLVLIVEDDQRIGSSLLRALTNSAITCGGNSWAKAALHACDEDPPDLALLDLGLPETRRTRDR